MGILVDSLGSIAVGIVYFVAVIGIQIARGQEVSEQMLDPHVSITAILGLLLTVAGGFVAGWLARTDEVRRAIAVGVGSVLIWFLAVIPAAALGGYVSARMNWRAVPQPL